MNGVRKDILERLPERKLLAYQLREDGLTFKEMGKVLGVCPETARMHYNGALRFIKCYQQRPLDYDGPDKLLWRLNFGIQNKLRNMGLKTDEAVRWALQSGRLIPKSGTNYGKRAHEDVCRVFGFDSIVRPSKAIRMYVSFLEKWGYNIRLKEIDK